MSILHKSILFTVALSLAACGEQIVRFPDGGGAPVVPTVTSTSPVADATGVGVGRTIQATFSELMAPATINATTILLKQGTTAVAGTVRSTGLTASFEPTVDLASNTTYTVTVTAGVKSAADLTPMAADFSWSFTTAVIPAPAPTIISMTPGSGSTGVPFTQVVRATFSRAMDAGTITGTSFTLEKAGIGVAGLVAATGTTASFTPSAPLDPATEYTATVTTAVKDPEAIALAADVSWSFTTAPAIIVIPPFVLSTLPSDASTGVPLNTQVKATFNRAMDAATLAAAGTFTVKEGVNTIAGVLTLVGGNVATFVPGAPLVENKTYTVTITTAAKDTAGVAMANDYVWTFLTPVPGAPTVTSTSPGHASTGVALSQQITANFSRTMDGSTITGTTFTVTTGGNAVAGAVSYTGTTARFIPTVALLANTTYTATITTGAKDVEGFALAANYVFSFTTLTPIAPLVVTTTPGNGSTGVLQNVQPTAVFSRLMDPTTITALTFTLADGLTPVAGLVTYAGSTANFAPTLPLAINNTYTATITTGAKDTAGVSLASNVVWTFTTVNPSAPLVTLTTPGNGSTGVLTTIQPTAQFNRAMDPLTITALTFTLADGVTPVAGLVTYLGTTATFAPTVALLPNKTYTATITTGAKDPAGIALAQNVVWTFTTAAAQPLQVTETDPANNSTGVLLNKVVTATFNRAMNPTTITPLTFTLAKGLVPVVGTVNYAGFVAEFVPTAPLDAETVYTATITTGAKDTNAVGLTVAKVWTFTTAAPLAPSPIVLSTNPNDGASGLCIPVKVDAKFDIPMDKLTFTKLSFTVSSPGPVNLNGAVTFDVNTNTASFAPATALAGATTYTATITTDVKSLQNRPLAVAKVWSFTSSLVPCTVGINLGSLGTFVAVAGAGLTNSNTQLPAFTSLNGDVGLSPTGTCMSDGSICNPPANAPRITGNLYANDPAGKAARAKADLVSAYNDAANRPVGTTIVANLAGQVLAPGIYSSGSTMDIAVGGILTLNGQGDQNATWIFRVGSALTANNGSQVVLTNGAKAKNVFWAIGSSSTIGSNASFKGTVMAVESNSVGTGSVVEGRLVCTTGQITLLSNTITLPAE